MRNLDRKLTVIISWMSGITAVIVTLGLPFVYFGLSFFYEDSAMITEAEMNAGIVSQLISENPEMWRYEELRLTDLMSRLPAVGSPETRRILDLKGETIAENAEKVDWPVHTRSELLLDSGTEVGRIEIRRSLRPLLKKTFFMALLGGLLGFGVFFLLRIFPLRTLRHALLSLAEEKERAQVTLRSICDGVISTDRAGNILMINPVAEKLTGWPQESAFGRPLQHVLQAVKEGHAANENPVERMLRDEKTQELSGNFVLTSKDGVQRTIVMSCAPMHNVQGSIIGFVLVFSDITQKQQFEAEMQKAAKIESIGILAGGIAHDFNNILTGMMGNISLAMLDCIQQGAVYERLVQAESACLRAKDLTFQLLTFSKGGAPIKETTSLPELIRSSSDFALTGSNVRSEIHIADCLPMVYVDPGQINQVLQNLIINAIEAMPQGGIITLRADPVRIRENGRLPLPEGHYVRISVEDHGIGVTKEHLPKIFDPYYTTKKTGSGLGLATCYSIIKNHGGHITVDSDPGKSTTFRFYLPASLLPAKDKNHEEDRVIQGTGRILVMDDEELVRNAAGDMLKHLGYEVVFAADGADAIDQYRRAKQSAKPFDAVILDLTIRAGMGGKETVQKIRELDEQVKAIVSSGYSENRLMSDFSHHGFKGVISKPYNLRQLSQVLHAVLHA